MAPNPLHLAEVFGEDEKTTIRCANSARALLEQRPSNKPVRTDRGLLSFCLSCPREIEDCPGTSPGH